jgi:hypothetical protein
MEQKIRMENFHQFALHSDLAGQLNLGGVPIISSP